MSWAVNVSFELLENILKHENLPLDGRFKLSLGLHDYLHEIGFVDEFFVITKLKYMCDELLHELSEGGKIDMEEMNKQDKFFEQVESKGIENVNEHTKKLYLGEKYKFERSNFLLNMRDNNITEDNIYKFAEYIYSREREMIDEIPGRFMDEIEFKDQIRLLNFLQNLKNPLFQDLFYWFITESIEPEFNRLTTATDKIHFLYNTMKFFKKMRLGHGVNPEMDKLMSDYSKRLSNELSIKLLLKGSLSSPIARQLLKKYSLKETQNIIEKLSKFNDKIQDFVIEHNKSILVIFGMISSYALLMLGIIIGVRGANQREKLLKKQKEKEAKKHKL